MDLSRSGLWEIRIEDSWSSSKKRFQILFWYHCYIPIWLEMELFEGQDERVISKSMHSGWNDIKLAQKILKLSKKMMKFFWNHLVSRAWEKCPFLIRRRVHPCPTHITANYGSFTSYKGVHFTYQSYFDRKLTYGPPLRLDRLISFMDVPFRQHWPMQR